MTIGREIVEGVKDGWRWAMESVGSHPITRISRGERIFATIIWIFIGVGVWCMMANDGWFG